MTNGPAIISRKIQGVVTSPYDILKARHSRENGNPVNMIFFLRTINHILLHGSAAVLAGNWVILQHNFAGEDAGATKKVIVKLTKLEPRMDTNNHQFARK